MFFGDGCLFDIFILVKNQTKSGQAACNSIQAAKPKCYKSDAGRTRESVQLDRTGQRSRKMSVNSEKYNLGWPWANIVTVLEL